MARGAAGSRAELVISLGVLLLGIGATVVAWRLPEAGGYARIGPTIVKLLFRRPQLAGEPAEIASTVVYLCSELAGYVNGHYIAVDGAHHRSAF